MTPSLWIASRYFFSKRRQRFVSLLTVTAIASIAVATMAMIVVLSVMRGFDREVTSRLIGFQSHITVTPAADAALDEAELRALLGEEDVEQIVPFIEGEAIAMSSVLEEPVASGVRVRGMPQEGFRHLKHLDVVFADDAGWSEMTLRKGEAPPVVIGSEIASTLAVHPKFADRVEIVAPLAEIGPTGEFAPRKQRFRVRGLFRAGVYQIAGTYALMPYDAAKQLLGQQGRPGWRILLEDPYRANDVARKLASQLPSTVEVRSWQEQNRKLFAALTLERWVMGTVLSLVMLIASFAIIGVLLMVAASKRKDIALLGTMGMRRRDLRSIFLWQGGMIGVCGACAGALAGTAFCAALGAWPIRLPASYYLDRLPVAFTPVGVTLFAALAVGLAIAAAVYPSMRAAKEPAGDVLRYE